MGGAAAQLAEVRFLVAFVRSEADRGRLLRAVSAATKRRVAGRLCIRQHPGAQSPPSPRYPTVLRHRENAERIGGAMTRLRLSGTGHVVLGLIALWGFLILATAMTVGIAE